MLIADLVMLQRVAPVDLEARILITTPACTGPAHRSSRSPLSPRPSAHGLAAPLTVNRAGFVSVKGVPTPQKGAGVFRAFSVLGAGAASHVRHSRRRTTSSARS